MFHPVTITDNHFSQEHKCPKCPYKSHSKFHWHRHVADNHGVEAVSLANIRKRKLELEKLEEKSSAKTPKFPNPVPAMKRESKQQPVGRIALSNSQSAESY